MNTNTSKLEPKTFAAIADLAYRESGLQLVAEKTSMIQSRLRHRLKVVGLQDFEKYASLVCSDAGLEERKHMISALTTNVSHFFREPHHFDLLKDEILPSAINRLKQGGRFRIWSAGCSNGQEAYSIAMTVLNNFPDVESFDFKILATDIDANVIKFASLGNYPDKLVDGIPKELLNMYFDSQGTNGDTHYQVKPLLRSLVTFKELNLLLDWPMKGQFDVIFCRNVVIYFDAKTQNALWPKFRQVMKPNGRLFLGHSERISSPETLGFMSSGPTAYSLATIT